MIKVSTRGHANRNDDRELGLSVDWGSRVEIQACLLTGKAGCSAILELRQNDHPV